MKKYLSSKKNLCFFVFVFALLLSVFSHAGASHASAASVTRGMWLSCFEYEEAGLYNQSEAGFKKSCKTIFKTLKKYGFNTIYFHVRPFDDSIYPDSSFKWCKWLSDEPLDYDALQILINTAHNYDISFHAWINPYRITTEKIYDPASDSTTDHIISGVKEIIENYDVDGIHFDDYFYPSVSPGKQFYDVPEDERMEHVNNMVSKVYSTIKNYDPDIIFGISPAGNVEYAESIGCDLDTWLTEDGYVDYIAPQIYWSDDYMSGKKSKTLFTDRFEQWADIGLGNIPVYPGLALYRGGMKSNVDRGWKKRTDNIAKQVKLCDFYDCNGYIFFSYTYLFTPGGKKELASYMKYISSLSVDKTSLKVKKGKTCKLSKLVSVKDKYSSYIKYSSSNKKIATVSSSGVIKARKKGRVRITIKGIAGSSTSCLIKVY